MKDTGIVRKIDELGRITIPIELRRSMYMNEGDQIEIFTDDDSIILKKYSKFCTFCGSEESILTYNGKSVCAQCVEKIKLITE